MKSLLEAIIAENPDTCSRGGAIFIKNGKIVEENTHYRDFLSVTGNGKIEYIKVSPVPFGQKPFEYYLNKTDESKF